MNTTTSLIVPADGSFTTVVVSTPSRTMEFRFVGGPGQVWMARAKRRRLAKAALELEHLADMAEGGARITVVVADEIVAGVHVDVRRCVFLDVDEAKFFGHEVRRGAEHLRLRGFPAPGTRVVLDMDDVEPGAGEQDVEAGSE